MNKVCCKCKNTDCEYKNKSIENMTIFCNNNCVYRLIQDAEDILPALEMIINTCENKPGFTGLYTQAATLLNAANKNII